MAAKKQQGLTKKQQEELVNAAVDGFKGLPAAVQKAILIIAAILIVVAGGWYFFFGGADFIAGLSGESTARTDVTGDYAWTEWNEGESPNYYRVDGAAIVEHPDVALGQIEYGKLDSEKRATYAVGYITGKMYKKELSEEREQNLPTPVGYRNLYVGENPGYKTTIIGKYIKFSNGYEYTGAFYNRSHLLADSLCGDPKKENLVTGTRAQNTGSNNEGQSGYGGMAYTEEITRQYFEKHPDGNVYYAVTPIYSGDELLPRSVYVDVKSDDGIVNLHVETYNCAKGYKIDYKTGDASAA